MARQVGNIVIVGTIDNLCFYERGGKYYVRMKPGPSRRRKFFKQARYQPQREAAERMVKSARLSSMIYGRIDKDKRERRLCWALQKKAAWCFKGKMSVEEVIKELGSFLVEQGYLSKSKAKALGELRSEPSLYRMDWDGDELPVDYFKGVKVRTREGRWFRLYHRDELMLLQSYSEQIKAGEEWLEAFLLKRKQLPTYRLKHKCQRRYKVKEEKVVVREAKKELGEVRTFTVPQVESFSIPKVSIRRHRRKEGRIPKQVREDSS